ncbi:hypothetical protein DV711_01400 [Motiliproteus coralliicola]|uniref:Helix-turn-helix domain-containing protein n=1 Tax=Motiliproteus coralliicola TaxID=2283196 RepID=A0A369WSZ4_9GAMM|nr:helix-turn-helix domain-containing protein [Motiliproteus coralliicola]RDE24273.1 hypothetical protein DV711_01400 [Motiliproteus coralliicola]
MSLSPDFNPTFARRLITADLIAYEERPSVPELMRLTGWPRRTLQDIIKALPGLGVEVVFVQDGHRNNDGYYQLNDWGALDQDWIDSHRAELHRLLNLTL